MDTAEAAHTRRTFARTNGLGGAAVPHLVAAEERHRKNLQHIRQLKAALCSTVSSAAPHSPATAPTSREASQPVSSSPSLPSPALPVWGQPRSHSSGIVASPAPSQAPPARETPTSVAVLQSSQQEVEQLTREKHQLQRQCIELASLLAGSAHSGSGSGTATSLAVAVPEPPSWSSVHDAALAVVEQVTRCYPSVVQDLAIAKTSPQETQTQLRGSRDARGSAVSSLTASRRGQSETARCERSMFTDVADVTSDELADALRRLADFLPRLASMTAVSEAVAEAGPDMLDHIHILEEEKQSDCLAVLSITDRLTQVSAQLRREAAEKDAALHALQHTVADLMEEKQEWARRARASEAALAERYTQYRQREKAWEKEVGELLQAKESLTSSTAAGAAAAAVGTEKVAQSNAAEEALADARRSAAAAEADLKRQLARLQEELESREAALEDLHQEHTTLQSTHAALQASSQEAAAAQQQRITALESQFHPLETELQAQADTIQSTLQKVEALAAAHRAELATLHESHAAALQAKEAALEALQAAKARTEDELAAVSAGLVQRTTELQAMTAARDAARAELLEEREPISVADSSSFLVTASTPLRLPRPGAGDVNGSTADAQEVAETSLQVDEGDHDDGADSISRCTNVRRLQQSLKRMSRERAALKRKLEHRGTALAEMETELEAVQRQAAQQEARLQVLQTGAERVDAAAVRDSAVVSETTKAASVTPINWITFAELELHEDEGTLYPTPVDLSQWLRGRKEPLRLGDYVTGHLSPHDQVLIDTVGPLYHVGFSLLKAEGLLGDDAYFPMIWRRLLMQLQQTLDAQLEGLSVSPADSARCFYELATTADLFRNPKGSYDQLEAYTLVLASLCVCLRPRDVDEPTPALASTEAVGATYDGAEGFSLPQVRVLPQTHTHTTKWQCCRAVLQHVCDQGDGESEATRQRHAVVAEGESAPYALLSKIASQGSAAAAAAAAFPSTSDSDASALQRETNADSRSDEAAVEAAASTATSNLAALLSHGLLSDALPHSNFSLQMLIYAYIAKRKTEGADGRHGAGGATERGLFSPVTPLSLPLSQRRTLTPLLLYLARHEYLLSGWLATAGVCSAGDDTPASVPLPALSLEDLGLQRSFSVAASSKSDVHASAAVERVAEVLMLLDTGVLPAAVLSIKMCRFLEHEPQLLHAFFETRRTLSSSLAKALTTNNATTATPSWSEPPHGLSFLSEAQLRECVQKVLAPAKNVIPVPSRVVQVPTAEYEQLQRELLLLYQTNEKYDTYIQELLNAAEAM